MFNEELGQSVLLLDTFFQFSQEKTKRREGKEVTLLGETSSLSDEINDRGFPSNAGSGQKQGANAPLSGQLKTHSLCQS